MTLLTKVTIDGIDVSEFLVDYSVSDAKDDEMGSVLINFLKTVFNLIDITTEMAIVITRGTTTSTDSVVFKGFVNGFSRDGVLFVVTGSDKLWILDRKEITFTYDKDIDVEAGVLSAIAESLIEGDKLDVPTGLTASVANSGTVLVLTKFICKKDSVWERLRTIKRVLQWNLFYNPTLDVVRFEPEGTTVHPNILTVGNNIINQPIWNYDFSNVFNVVTIEGLTQEVETTEEFSGDGIETDFTLTNTPESVKIFVGGVLKIGGDPDTSATFDYSIDKENKKIVFVVAPASGSNNVDVEYSYLIPRPVTITDDISVTSFGEYKKTFRFDDLQDLTDAESRGQNIIDSQKDPVITTELQVKGELIFAGTSVQIVDGFHNENRTLVVQNSQMDYPLGFDTIKCGTYVLDPTKTQQDTEDRLKRLERENIRSQEIVTSVRTASDDIIIKLRYIKLLKNVLDLNNSFILDHPTAGILDTSKFGQTLTTTEEQNRIVWPNNSYEEDFVDTDMRDSTKTNAVWNTGVPTGVLNF